MTEKSLIALARKKFHNSCIADLLVLDKYTPKSGPNKGQAVQCASNADGGNEASRFIANDIARSLNASTGHKLKGQTSGHVFETKVANFIEDAFLKLDRIRPGRWSIAVLGSRKEDAISSYDQYSHIQNLSKISKENRVLRSSLGNDYSIAPDIVVTRSKYEDVELNKRSILVDETTGMHTALRKHLDATPLLHASVSCKWTMRSDRAQNARSEALNLIRNRKGRAPHIMAVVGEPTPSRLASIALGTGDLDCVYHFALYELQAAVSALGQSEAEDLLAIMVEGKRLKDISDLPLDLCV